MSAKLSPIALAAALAALTAGSAVAAGVEPARVQGAEARVGDATAGAPRTPQAAVEPIDMRPQRDVDESALRYYAAQKDVGRVDAETRRLKALYPEWNAPDDLWTAPELAPPDEGPLWTMYSEDRIDELQAAVAARRLAEPGWAPSRDLDVKMRRKIARRTVIALWNEKKWKEIVAYAQADPMVAEIGEVDILWSLAEGFANAKQRTGALSIYTAIMSSSSDGSERLGTLHKAIANLQMADVEKLVAMGRKGADGKNEFDVILVDIVRARISAYLHDERKEEVIASDLKAFEDYARAAADPNQPGLVAWYRYKRQQFTPALEWFKIALQKGGDSMIAHGLAHSLRELGHFRETEEVAYAWREKLINNRILYVDILERDLTREIPPYVETERLARYGRLAAQDASGEAAQALAWYAYNSCQFDVALEWFERAVAWLPKQETVYGYALTLRRLKREQAFLEVVNRVDGLHPKVVELVFPEERYRPPTPCETATWDQARWWEAFLTQNPWVLQNKNDAVKENARQLGDRQGVAATVRHGDGPYTAGYDGFVRNALHDPLGRYSWGVVTGPTGTIHAQWKPENVPFQPPVFGQLALPGLDRFPLAVLPENPLRFAAQSGSPDAVDRAASKSPAPAQPAQRLPGAGLGAYARDPYAGPYPIIARRVSDVGPMPYEKFGGVVLPNPEPGKPLGSIQSEAGNAGGAGAIPPAVSHETTGSIRKLVVAGAAPSPAPPAIAQPLAQSNGALPVTPPPGMTWATPPELLPPGVVPASPMGGFASPRPVEYGQYGQAGVNAIYAAPAPQIYAPQQVAPVQLAEPTTARSRRAASRLAAQAQAAPVPVVAQPMPGMIVQPGLVMPQRGGVYYAAPPPTTLRPTAFPAQPAVYAPPAQQPVVVGGYAPGYLQQPMQVIPLPVAAQPASAPPRRRRVETVRRQEVVRRTVVSAPAPVAEPSSSGGGGGGRASCSLGASGTAAELSPQRAVAAGWCLVNAKRPAEAAIAFDRAIAAGGKTAQDAAYGKSIAMIQSNDPKAAAAAAAAGGVSGKRRDDIGKMAMEQRIFQTYDAGDYSGALRLLRQRAAYSAETRDLTLMRAWSNYQLGDLDEARRLFRMLDDQMSTKQSRSGLAAIDEKRTRMQY